VQEVVRSVGDEADGVWATDERKMVAEWKGVDERKKIDEQRGIDGFRLLDAVVAGTSGQLILAVAIGCAHMISEAASE
jgi:hypothetical protein